MKRYIYQNSSEKKDKIMGGTRTRHFEVNLYKEDFLLFFTQYVVEVSGPRELFEKHPSIKRKKEFSDLNKAKLYYEEMDAKVTNIAKNM